MKKILLVSSNSIHSKRYLVGILASKSFDVMIITNQFMDEFSDIRQVIVNFALHNLSASRIIFDTINKFIPDVIHIHQANSYAWHTFRAVKRLSYKPKVVLTTWGSDILLLPKRSKLMKKMVVSNLLNSDVITSDSLFMSSQISSLIKPKEKPIKTINFGIQELPSMQDLSLKKKFILSNRLHKSLYRIDKIVIAFAYLVRAQLIGDDYMLVIAASGDQTSLLKDLVTKNNLDNRVIFTGFISYSELVNYYRNATVFVSVPESDGTASSLLEAMAYGCIPVLSNIPANLEWVINDINGFIAPDISELSGVILSAVNIANNSRSYQSLYDLNYSIIKNKAVFADNISKFIGLYE